MTSKVRVTCFALEQHAKCSACCLVLLWMLLTADRKGFNRAEPQKGQCVLNLSSSPVTFGYVLLHLYV